jgi:hypothetical protein
MSRFSHRIVAATALVSVMNDEHCLLWSIYSEVSNFQHTTSPQPLCYAASTPTTVVLVADF